MNPHVPLDVDRDERVREVLDVHFDPETGTPYWLEWADEHDVDPRDAVGGFEDLKSVFEPFDEDVIRHLPVEEFAPQALDGPRRVYETGGTTGAPKRVIMQDYWRIQASWAASVLDGMGFPTGNTLMIGPPGGANNAGVFVQHLAHEWDALPFHINMDPRWAKRLSTGPRNRFDEYVDHLLDQAERVLTSQNIDVVFSTARLFERPRLRDLVAETGVRGVYHGGTALDPDTHRVFREEWYDDVAFVGEYGNTLMGVAQEAPHLRPPAERAYSLDYVPCEPYFVAEIVDEDGDVVPYGETGRVRVTVLGEDLFVPLLPERDTAMRVRGVEPLDWDWVRDPGTSADAAPGAVEGVY
ncbi:MAG: hypothetical protein ABEH78_09250 [Haloferacaceae archaeon]